MTKIPFDIKYRPQIESGEYKVETSDGRPARIICWDLNAGEYVIAAVIRKECGEDSVETYTDDGRYLLDDESGHDLFVITPEPELSEFEKATLRAFDKMCAGEKHLTPRTNHIQEAAAELLALARKEIEKDLPRWKKCEDGDAKQFCAEALDVGSGRPHVIAFRVNGYRIFLSDLEKLPKEDEK